MPLRKAFLSGLFAGAWIFVVVQAWAQPGQINFDIFSDENGLPDNQVRNIMQDRDGFLWMGRHNGLSKFDGYTITSFRHIPGDSTTISGNVIMNLYEDRQGRLWVCSNLKGVDVSDPYKTTFRPVQLHPDSTADMTMNVSEVVQDLQQRMWLITNEGIVVLQESESGFSRIDLDDLLHGGDTCSFPTSPTQLACSKEGIIYMGGGEGLTAYDPSTKKLTCPRAWPGLRYKTVTDIAFDRNDRLWVSIATNKGRLFYAEPGSQHFTFFDKIPFDTVFNGCAISFDLDNRIWLSVFGDQMYAYDFSDSTLFFQSGVNPGLSHERFLRKAIVDHSGKIWMPCEGYVTMDYPKGFKSYKHSFPFIQTISTILVTAETTWLAIREEGILRIDRQTGETLHLSTNHKDNTFIPTDLIVKMLPLRSGNLMVVGFDHVFILHPEGKLIRDFPMAGTNRAGIQDSKGRIWMGNIGGWHLFSETEGILKSYKLPPILGDKRNFIQDFAEDAHGNLWIASGGMGLVRFNPETSEIKQFQHDKKSTSPLPSNNVIDVATDHENLVWVATELGLLRMHTVTLDAELFDMKSGLANDNIQGVIIDNDGVLWMTTNMGISSLHPITREVMNYFHHDGLINISFNHRALTKGPDGTLYFGGRYGLDFFKPKDLRINSTSPKMKLTGVSLIRDGVTHTFPHQEAVLHLSYRDDLISIEFSGMHYSDQDKVRYHYLLEPLHEDWVDLGTEHKVLFSNLKPGEYTFRAKAITPDGVESEEALALPIVVSPPFYQTLVFRFLLFCLILAIVIAYVRYRERLVKNKQQQESEVSRKLMELEKRALQAQMNPHFIYNSMNSIQQFILMHDTEGAMKYLTRFSRILRTVLNMSSQSRIPLYEEIKLIEDYIELESMRFPNKFTYKIDVSPELNIHAVEIPPFFIQPQVENAIRHGLLRKETPGHLHIALLKEGETLHITVEDNGIGREASRASKFNEVNKHESKGLGIIEERLKYLNSPNGHEPFKIIDLYDAEQKSIGTRVEITLPMD